MTANRPVPAPRKRTVHPVYAVTALIAGVALLIAAVALLATNAGKSPSGGAAGPAANSSQSTEESGTQSSSPALSQSTPADQGASPSLRPDGASANRLQVDPADAQLVVPPECAQLALVPGVESGAQQFTNGVATSPSGAGEVRIEAVHDVSTPQDGATAVVLSCVAPGGETQQAVAVYNPTGALTTAVEPWAGWGRTMLRAHVPLVRIAKLETYGSELHITVPGVQAAPMPGALAGTDVQATIVLRWLGERYEYNATHYQSAAGIWEHPQAWRLQEFYDALSNGKDTEAAKHTSPENMRDVQTGCISACENGVSNYRSAIFPPGGVVEECVLIGELGVPLPEIDGSPRKLPLEVGGQAGDFFCGIRRPGQGLDPDGTMTYAQWFIVRSPLGEGYFVTQFGRAFS